MTKQISIPALRRLPSYYHIICQAYEAGEKYISSGKIAKELEIDDTQVRKDIAATGYVGKPKVGFDVADFKSHLEIFLGLENKKEAFIIGAGNLGIALAKYDGFKKYGLNIKAIFDSDPKKIDMLVGNTKIFDISEFESISKNSNIKIAILTVPADIAQQLTDYIVESGIKAIWNFSPIKLKAPDDVIICNQDLAASFITFSQLVYEKLD